MQVSCLPFLQAPQWATSCSLGREPRDHAWPSRSLRIMPFPRRPAPVVGRVRWAGWPRSSWCWRSRWPCAWSPPMPSSGTSVGEGPTRLCVFPDTVSYWELARTIRAGDPYEVVEWADIPHFALRTPGYPLVLAACQAVFGERTLAVRLVQAVLGTLSVYLIYCLARQFASPENPEVEPDGRPYTTMDRPAGRRGAGGGQPALPADVVADPVRGGFRAPDAGLAPGPGGALAGPSAGRCPTEVLAGDARRPGHRGRRRGRGPGAAVLGAVCPGDAGRLDRCEPPRSPRPGRVDARGGPLRSLGSWS